MFHLHFHAVDVVNNIRRNHEIVVDRDLLGDLIVDTRRGRIGELVGAIRREFSEDEAAPRIVRQHLMRRAAAPKRVGVPYVVVDALDVSAVGLTAREVMATYPRPGRRHICGTGWRQHGHAVVPHCRQANVLPLVSLGGRT